MRNVKPRVDQAGLCQTFLETPKTGFLATRLVYFSKASIFGAICLKVHLFNIRGPFGKYVARPMLSCNIVLETKIQPLHNGVFNVEKVLGVHVSRLLYTDDDNTVSSILSGLVTMFLGLNTIGTT